MTRLRLQNFRNYLALDLVPAPGLNLIRGPNGHGKSNLIEALFFVASTRSLRTHREDEVIAFDAPWARIEAELQRGHQILRAELFWQRGKGGLEKTARLNRQDVKRLSELFSLARMVCFTADDLRLVQEGPVERRRYLDYLLCKASASYLDTLQHYQQILKQRNRWLQQPDGVLKPILDEQLLRWGGPLKTYRAEAIQELSDIAAGYYRTLATEDAPLALEYRPGLADDAEKQLQRRAGDELRRGTTLVGPHRDEILIHLGPHLLRSFGSRGQQRTAALALRLAEGELMQKRTKEAVIHLMDDCMSELDEARQQFLWQHLQKQSQVFVTGTADALQHAPAEAIRYDVRKGATPKRWCFFNTLGK